MERDGDTVKRARGEEEHGAKRLKGTMSLRLDAFCCGTCTQLLEPPIFQCSKGHFFLCSSCHEKQPKCRVCMGDHQSCLERSHGMERAVESILVDCRYAEHGCPEKTTYYNNQRHEQECPRTPASCPYSGCSVDVCVGELLDHLTVHHMSPCTEFGYWDAFDLRVDEPGVHVLRCTDDGQHILLHAQPAEQPRGRAVSVVCVPPCHKPTGIGCSVSFSPSGDHYYGTSMVGVLRSSKACFAPDFLCFVPEGSGEPDEEDEDGVVLRINFMCARDDDEDSDDSTYTETDDETETDD